MLVFVELMISLNTLQQRQNFTQPVNTPSRYAKAGMYPTQYRLTYDAQNHEYRVSIDGLRSAE